jgi:hypothetical protein
MLFDGSDVGVNKRLSSFALLDDGSIVMSLAGRQAGLAGLAGTVLPHDVVRFVPSSLGAVTTGFFEWYFDGSDVGLTTDGEKIDALDVLDDGRLLISTAGVLKVPLPGGGALVSQDEDLTALTPTALGATTSGTWALYFNGTAVPGLGREDVAGAHVDEATGEIYLTLTDKFIVGGAGPAGVSGNGKDVLKLTPAGGGYTVARFWRGPENGFAINIGGLEID